MLCDKLGMMDILRLEPRSPLEQAEQQTHRASYQDGFDGESWDTAACSDGGWRTLYSLRVGPKHEHPTAR